MRRDPAVSSGRSVTVLPGAAHLRRVVGPTAWVVLETLLQDAESTGSDDYVAHRSIRDLAAEIGLAKDFLAACSCPHRIRKRLYMSTVRGGDRLNDP
jgi:hypothetical protein